MRVKFKCDLPLFIAQIGIRFESLANLYSDPTERAKSIYYNSVKPLYNFIQIMENEMM